MARILIVDGNAAPSRRLPKSFLSRIIIISGELDPQAVAAALDNGVDDVVPRYCQLPELLARIHAALRRPPAATPDSVLEVGPLRLEKRQGIGERTVDVHVCRLRAALEPHACEHLLQTVRGYGYRLGG